MRKKPKKKTKINIKKYDEQNIIKIPATTTTKTKKNKKEKKKKKTI